MRYRTLGRTGLSVSEIGLGGEYFVGLPQEEVVDIINEAVKEGINIIDIFMPQAEVRTNLGNALKEYREKFIIQGHLCTVTENSQYKRTRSIESTMASFEDLLERLQTNYIDIGMIHYVDNEEDYTAVFESKIIEYAKHLKSKGIIKYIGMSSHNPSISLKAVKSGMIDVLMFSINPAYDMEGSDTDFLTLKSYKGLSNSGFIADNARQKLYTACENEGVAITVMKALGAGTLLSGNLSPFEASMTVAQCTEYALQRNGVKSVLIGCKNLSELYEALEYFKLSEKERDYSHIYTGNKIIKMTGRCMYCNHCKPCPMNIDIATVTKFLDLAKYSKQSFAMAKEHYYSLDVTADSCIMCGACEPNCPFGVSITDNMKEAIKIFATIK